jgi:hypothetical protein
MDDLHHFSARVAVFTDQVSCNGMSSDLRSASARLQSCAGVDADYPEVGLFIVSDRSSMECRDGADGIENQMMVTFTVFMCTQ